MKYKYFKEVLLVVVIAVISMFLNQTIIINTIKIYFNVIPTYFYIFITLLVFCYFIKTVINSTYLIYLVITYLVFLIMVLFLRVPNNISLEDKFYLVKWIKLLLTNKTVFINIIGNIILFIPYGYILMLYIKHKYVVLISIIPIILIELIQYITKLGIFDIVDIFLNYIGTLIGIFGERSLYESRQKRRN